MVTQTKIKRTVDDKITRIKPIMTVGRRKTSSARVFLTPFDGPEKGDDSEQEKKIRDETIIVNKKPFSQYFTQQTTQMIILEPLEITDTLGKYLFRINVSGGGISGQAGAVRHGIARALEKSNPELRNILKKKGFLTRDPRVVERKKPGRHKARKKPQFSKR